MRRLSLLTLVLAFGCTEDTNPGLGGSGDSGSRVDTGAVDLGQLDSGASDANALDMMSVADSGRVDASRFDTGGSDTGSGDAGETDAGNLNCMQYDEAVCDTVPGCSAFYCPGSCDDASYSGCFGPNDPPPPCPPPGPCMCEFLEEGWCGAAPNCHKVFYDAGDCPCTSPGCCARFSRCAEGAVAQCFIGEVICDIVPPYCAGPYVISYENQCYEGCVLQDDCAP